MPPGAPDVSDAWIVVVIVGVVTALFKAAGPVFIGGRRLPRSVQSAVELLAPVMLTALVVTQTFGGNGELTVDARVPGVAAGGVAVLLRVHVVLAMALAAAVAGLVRLAA
jgi:branched-subunit amino acid transport protein